MTTGFGLVALPLPLAEPYTYRIPVALADRAVPGARVVVCSADLAGIVAQANAALPEAQRLSDVLVTRYADALPDGPIAAEEAPNAATEQWLRADPPLPEGGPAWTRWTDALAQRLVPSWPGDGFRPGLARAVDVRSGQSILADAGQCVHQRASA